MADVSRRAFDCDLYERPTKRSRVGPQYQASVPDAPDESPHTSENDAMAGALVWSPDALPASDVDRYLESAGGISKCLYTPPSSSIESLLSVLHASQYDVASALSSARKAAPACGAWGERDWARFGQAHAVYGFDFDSIAHAMATTVGDVQHNYYMVGGPKAMARRARASLRRLRQAAEEDARREAEEAAAQQHEHEQHEQQPGDENGGEEEEEEEEEDEDDELQETPVEEQGEQRELDESLQDTPLSELPGFSLEMETLFGGGDSSSLDAADPLGLPEEPIVVIDDEQRQMFMYD
eukprot:m51a1_g1107 hypothetical protein (296) ;mRNA; r:131768-132940